MKYIILILSILILTAAESDDIRETSYVRGISISGHNCTIDFFDEDTEPVTVNAEKMSDIPELAELQTGTKIFTGYTELVILNNCDYSEILESALNDFKVSPNCIVAEGKTDFRNESSEFLISQINRIVEQKILPECDLITVLGNLLNNNTSLTLPRITYGGINGITG